MGKNLKGKELGKNISQRKDGRYEAKYTDQFGKRHSICDSKLAVVRKKLTEALYYKDHNIYVSDCKLTLNEWFDIWQEKYYKNSVKYSTYTEKIIQFNNHIRNSKLGDMLLQNIKPLHIQDFINNKIDDNCAPSSIKLYLSTLRQLFKQAVNEGFISKTPYISFGVPKKETKTKQILSQEEEKIFFKYAKKYKYYDLYKFLLFTGVRIGEALALNWEDVDMTKKIIYINKTVDYYTGKRQEILKQYDSSNQIKTLNNFIYGKPKTHKSNRLVYMSDDCYDLLKQLLNERNNKETDLIFHTRLGLNITTCAVDKNLKLISNLINEHGIKFPHISAHCFRHTFATRCIEQGVNPQVVQTLLGHSSLVMTLGIYTHITENYIKQELSKL